MFAGRLPAAWNVTARNPHFVGRAELLTELRRRLRAGEHTLVVQALHGLGGVGKTQLAIEYVHRFAADYKLVWWIDAEQPALLAGQLAALAGPLGLPTGRPVGEAVPMVLAELRHRPRWLLVFDNAQRPQDLLDYWPDGGGQVVVTSRYPGWGGLGGRLEVDVLARAETVELLRRRLPEVDEELADQLAASSLALPLFWLGEAEGARALAQDTVDRARRMLGPNHRTTVYAEAVLTLALVQLGQPHLARTLGHNMVERGRRVLGADHMVTLDVAATLTLALVQLGEPGPARALGEDTVQRCRRVLGPDHQVTLLTAAALTLALIELGEPEPACALGEDTMERSLRMCGPDYIVRLLSATSLALALARLGKPEAARTLGKDTLDRCRRVYGSHHPFTRFVAHVVGTGSPGRSPLISLGTSQGTQ